MQLESYIPSARLKPYIQEYKVVTSHEGTVNRVLPGIAPVLAVRIQGQVNYLLPHAEEKLPGLALTGFKNSVRLIHYTARSTNILVIFKIGGAAAFFREPMHHLFEESIPLDDLISQSEVSPIEEQLGLIQNNPGRIALLEKWLLSKLLPHSADPLIQAATKKIQETRGQYPIKTLAESFYISQDAFEKRFRKLVGASPKQFSSVIRMKSMLTERPRHASLTEIALTAGFFDQSHFNKDFKRFTGLTPSDFLQSPPLW